MIQILANAARSAPIPKKMLKTIATPYHLRILLELLIIVSPASKLKIIKIFETFIKNEIPEEVFNQAVSS